LPKHIIKPEMLFERVARSTSAYAPTARWEKKLDLADARAALERALADGIKAVAIVFMHAYRYPEHEKAVAKLARDMGFPQSRSAMRFHRSAPPPLAEVGRGKKQPTVSVACPSLERCGNVLHTTHQGPFRHSGRRIGAEGVDTVCSPRPTKLDQRVVKSHG